MKKMYRILSTLHRGGGKYIPQGTISDLAELRPESIAAHLLYGQISEIAAPPLRALPGAWKGRADLLAPAGIVYVTEFLEADEAVLAELLAVKGATVKKFKRELEQFLS
jgi:hypothetical protein